jgi:RNA polymerase sigma factor (sigma-70 family)
MENADSALKSMDEQTLRILLENRKAFLGFLRKRLPSEETAEDLLQHSLLKAVRAEEGLANPQSSVAWFYRILRNSLTDFYRSRAADGRRTDGMLNEMIASGGDHIPPPDDELTREICACFNRLLPTLKPEYAELVRRIDLGGESPAAVAESAGITYNNIMVRLHRSRQALRQRLEKSCGACTKHGCLDCTCGHGGGHGNGEDRVHPHPH